MFINVIYWFLLKLVEFGWIFRLIDLNFLEFFLIMHRFFLHFIKFCPIFSLIKYLNNFFGTNVSSFDLSSWVMKYEKTNFSYLQIGSIVFYRSSQTWNWNWLYMWIYLYQQFFNFVWSLWQLCIWRFLSRKIKMFIDQYNLKHANKNPCWMMSLIFMFHNLLFLIKFRKWLLHDTYCSITDW